MFSAEQMFWKYWSPRTDWSGSRSFVLMAGERLVAHGAVMPLRFSAGGRARTLLHLFDWAAEPGAIGSGSTLLRRIAALADGVLILGGSAATRAMVRPLGFRPLPEVTRYAVPARAPLDPIGDAYALARSSEPPAHLLDRSSTSGGGSVVFERSAQDVRAFLDCPVVESECRVVSKAGLPIGFFLLACAAAQARIVEAWSTSPDPRDWSALFRLARQVASEHAVAEVVCLAADPLEEHALLAAGFSRCGTVPLHVFAPADVVPDQTRVRLRMIDGDIAFLHHGPPERWGSVAESD